MVDSAKMLTAIRFALPKRVVFGILNNFIKLRILKKLFKQKIQFSGFFS